MMSDIIRTGRQSASPPFRSRHLFHDICISQCMTLTHGMQKHVDEIQLRYHTLLQISHKILESHKKLLFIIQG